MICGLISILIGLHPIIYYTSLENTCENFRTKIESQTQKLFREETVAIFFIC